LSYLGDDASRIERGCANVTPVCLLRATISA